MEEVKTNKGPIWVALSGGVDSATAAALLLKDGYQVEGVFMELWDCGLMPRSRENTCCSPEDRKDVMRVTNHLGIPLRTVDLRAVFKETVIRDFVDSYLSGLTPNPCIRCNQWVKYGALLDLAIASGAKALATGHYAKVARDPGTGLLRLLRAEDHSKDQSYFLFTLGQRELERTIWPLGRFSKHRVRSLAREFGIPVAEKRDSQEVCFLAGGDYREFLSLYWGPSNALEGEIVDWEGRVLGTHKGVHSYTIGQRKGLGIPWKEPLYVIGILPRERKVIVGPKSKNLSMGLEAREASWVAGQPPGDKFQATVRIRYRHAETPAFIQVLGPVSFRVMFNEPQPAVTPGQAVVIYKGDEVIGGGWISGRIEE